MEDPTFATPVHEINFEVAIYELWGKGCGIIPILENKQNRGLTVGRFV